MSDQNPQPRPFPQQLMVIIVGLIALIYLINPTAGFIEFIPDNFPVVGNLDEAGAVVLLLSSLRYYGLDLANFFKIDSGGHVVEGDYVEVGKKEDEEA